MSEMDLVSIEGGCLVWWVSFCFECCYREQCMKKAGFTVWWFGQLNTGKH